MAEHMKGPKKAVHHKAAPGKSKEAASRTKLQKACSYIAKGVRAGVMSAFLANQAMAAMGCGARTELPEDEMATIHEDSDDAGSKPQIDAGNDDGGSKPGVDAGGSKGIITDDGGSKPGVDAGGSKGIDIDAGGSKEESAG